MSNRLKNAALMGMINVLLSPEYGTEWLLKEVLPSTFAEEEVNDELAEEVDVLISSRFRELAQELAAELDSPHREQYLEEITSRVPTSN